jgi:hypothetical protein
MAWVNLNLRLFVRYISKPKFKNSAWVNLKLDDFVGIFKFEIRLFEKISDKFEP